MAAFRDGNSVIEIHPGEIYGKMLELEARSAQAFIIWKVKSCHQHLQRIRAKS